ncbi:MAG: alpha/beta hydrolase [Pseudomonadota bacterium]
MAIAALATDRLTLVSLVGDDGAFALPRFLQGPAFRDAGRILVRAQTAAQRNLTASRIDAAIAEADRAVLLVAQGAGCLAAAWWARLSPESYVSRVAGALMIAPDDRGGVATRFASPRASLPFPSIVVGASDAEQRLAGEWGSSLIDGPVPGRLAGGAGSGRFQSLIARFTSAIVDHDVRAAERMIAALGDR